MLKLTEVRTNEPIYINEQYIITMRTDKSGTHIVVSSPPLAYWVKESIEEILSIIGGVKL